MSDFKEGATIKVERDGYRGYATVLRVGRSGSWATVQTTNGGTMLIGKRHVVATTD